MLAQVVSDASFMEAIVGYGVAFPLVAWLVWQLRSDRAAYRDDTKLLRTELSEERAANRELLERLIAQQAATIPIVTAATETIRDTADLLRRTRT